MNTQPNPAQAAGTVPSYEQGLSKLLSKQQGAKAEDFVAPSVTEDTDENGYPVEEAEQLSEQSTEPEADQDENAESVSADDSQPEKEEPDTRPILLPDGSEITVEEARKGYLRQSDWTRKTQAIAQEREQLQAQHSAKMGEVERLVKNLTSLEEQEPDWLALARDPQVDPKQLQAAQAYWTQKKATIAEAQNAAAQTARQAAANAKAQARETLLSGELNKAWKDPAVFQKDLEKTADWMVEMGFSATSVNNLANPLSIWVADMARKQFELEKAKPKAALAVKGKPAPFKPGAKSTASPQAEGLKLLQEKFRTNPSMENGIALERARASLRKPGLRQ
jgi:hypothetical protein